MIIKTELSRIRHYMTNIILSAVEANKKYINTYYKHKISLTDSIGEEAEEDETYEQLISFSFFCEREFYITYLCFNKKKELEFGYTDKTQGIDHTGTIDLLPLEILYSIIKWLQAHNYLDDISGIKYFYFCGKTKLQKLAWVNANADNQFIQFYDESDNNVFCDKCQRNTSYLEYNKDVPIEFVNQWFTAASVDIKEEITGLSTKNFKNDKDHSGFQLKCNQFWKAITESVKRNFWVRYRDI